MRVLTGRLRDIFTGCGMAGPQALATQVKNSTVRGQQRECRCMQKRANRFSSFRAAAVVLAVLLVVAGRGPCCGAAPVGDDAIRRACPSAGQVRHVVEPAGDSSDTVG